MSDVQTKVFEPTPELTDLLIRSGSAFERGFSSRKCRICKGS